MIRTTNQPTDRSPTDGSDDTDKPQRHSSRPKSRRPPPPLSHGRQWRRSGKGMLKSNACRTAAKSPARRRSQCSWLTPAAAGSNTNDAAAAKAAAAQQAATAAAAAQAAAQSATTATDPTSTTQQAATQPGLATQVAGKDAIQNVALPPADVTQIAANTPMVSATPSRASSASTARAHTGSNGQYDDRCDLGDPSRRTANDHAKSDQSGELRPGCHRRIAALRQLVFRPPWPPPRSAARRSIRRQPT